MQLTVALICLAISLTTLDAMPWSPSDPMQSTLYQFYKNQKQRNLAKIKLLPQSKINFVGPRQATSLEEEPDDDADDDDYYYGDGDYGDEKQPFDYGESEEADYEWR